MMIKKRGLALFMAAIMTFSIPFATRINTVFAEEGGLPVSVFDVQENTDEQEVFSSGGGL